MIAVLFSVAAIAKDRSPAATATTLIDRPSPQMAIAAASRKPVESQPWGVPPVAAEAPPSPWIDPAFSGRGTITIARGGAALAETAGGPATMTVREGVTFAALSWDGEWIEIQTTCSSRGFVHRSQVRADAAAPDVTVGAGLDFSQAVIVVDPGHGGPRNIGGVGPQGTTEKEVVLDIARRVRDLLNGSHGVDWATGEITTAGPIPPAGRVILTRTGKDADYEVRLDSRAAIANAANAQALVSIHTNAGWAVELNYPGSDVYYQSQPELRPQSVRLARLIAEEFQRSFLRFDANWTGEERTGAKSRESKINPGQQFYGVLRHTEVPAVIAEGAYINSVTQERLLRTPEFRQAYANAVYRALVRYFTTDESGGAKSWDPDVYPSTRGNAGGVDGCVIPSQP